ncbi:MAG: hypothetical protein Q9168_004962 [Polycauliona sp. 1 TL-2023]
MAKRKAPARASKKDPYSLEQLLTSDKSKLIDIDLHGLLADFFGNPSNWTQVSAEDQEFIRSLLPPHLELTNEGSIPNDFWRYNPEFRLDCRNLQEDLRAGRMDPEWQIQAQQAMEERVTGAFDNFKEREFEEYWGQKQKVDWQYLAGDASKIKLEELLDAGLFKEGDIWSFDHTFGRGSEAVTIQKECKVHPSRKFRSILQANQYQIMDIDGKSLTFAIPPGQLKFARRFDMPIGPEAGQVTAPQQSAVQETTENAADGGITMGEPLSTIEKPDDAPEATSLADRSRILDLMEDPGEGAARPGGDKPGVAAPDDIQTLPPIDTQATGLEPKVPTAPSTPKRIPEQSNNELSTASSSPLSDIPDTPINNDYGVIQFTISTLMPLEKKIIEIDGRLPSSMRTASTWRDIRCRRDEQDMGSLFEMRDEYYAYQVAGKEKKSRRGKKS